MKRQFATAAGLAAALCAALSVGAGASSPPPIVPPPGIHMHRVGYPVQAVDTPGACIGLNHIYEVMTGTPPKLVELNPNGSLVASVPLSHGYNAWAVVRGTDGTIYTAVTTNTSTRTGYLYAWTPGQPNAKVVATLPNTVTVWSLAVDPTTGIVWIGGQALFAYAPQSGALHSYGMPDPQEHDIHALAAYGGVVYAGLTPYAEVVRFTPATGATAVVQDRTDQTSGVARISAPDANTLEILWESGALEIFKNGSPTRSDYMNGAETASVSLFGHEYTFLEGAIAQDWEYGYGGNNAAQIQDFPGALSAYQNERVVAIGALGNTIVGVLNDGDLLSVDPATATWQFALYPVAVPGTPGIIHAIYADPSGALYTSVYLGGEVTKVVGSHFATYPFPFQADGFASWGGMLYIGGYPGGWLYAYDESKPWNLAAGNPAAVGEVQMPGGDDPQQDRTYAVAAGPAGVYLGTIPTPGYLDGNLGYYSPSTGDFTVYDSPVPNEAITSLVYDSGGMLVGTTTAFGGGNVTPTHRSGRLFVWNPATQSLVKTYVPIAGMPEWGGLVAGPGGLVYGASSKAVFSFNPATGQVRTRVYNPSGKKDEWSSLTHMVTWRGRLFLLTEGQLYAVNPTTLAAAKLFYGAEQLAVGGNFLYLSYHGSVALEEVPLGRLTPANCRYPSGYITEMDRHPNLIP